MIPHVHLQITGPGDVPEARRAALRVASEHDLDETSRGRIAIIVTELASNLARHAERGALLIGCHSTEDGCQFEAVSVDHGPGIADVNRCLRGGHDSGGLRAVRQLSSDFSIYSRVGRGTVILARVWTPAMSRARANSPRQRFAHAGICLAAPGRPVSADGWEIVIDDAHARARVIVVDGVHDHPAASASRLRDTFRECIGAPGTVLHDLHDRLRGTPGAAAVVVEADARQGTLAFAGVGSVAARIAGSRQVQSMPSVAGRLGVHDFRVDSVVMPWPDDAAVILHSDGLATDWSIDDAPGLLLCDPAVIAGWLLRDHARPDADLAIVVLKRS